MLVELEQKYLRNGSLRETGCHANQVSSSSRKKMGRRHDIIVAPRGSCPHLPSNSGLSFAKAAGLDNGVKPPAGASAPAYEESLEKNLLHAQTIEPPGEICGGIREIERDGYDWVGGERCPGGEVGGGLNDQCLAGDAGEIEPEMVGLETEAAVVADDNGRRIGPGLRVGIMLLVYQLR